MKSEILIVLVKGYVIVFPLPRLNVNFEIYLTWPALGMERKSLKKEPENEDCCPLEHIFVYHSPQYLLLFRPDINQRHKQLVAFSVGVNYLPVFCVCKSNYISILGILRNIVNLHEPFLIQSVTRILILH